MGPELESKGKPEETPEALACKENEVVSADFAENKHLKCESSCGGISPEIGGLVVEPTNSGSNKRLVKAESQEATDFRLVKVECQEATDNSSSFDGTDSDIENSANLSDSEVISGFHGDGSSALELNGFVDIFRLRKKKLTSHWRTFIRPLMWRCKWVELQIKKFDMQARKYHRELAGYNHTKHFLSENIETQETCMKTFPLPDNSPRDEVLRRKKRKITEETTDVASYISHHNLFSYYEKSNRTASGTRVDEDWISQDKLGNDESEANDEGLLLESRGGDNSVEEMFQKIGKLQSQVTNLKSRLDKVKSENPGNLSLADDLGLPVSSSYGLTSSARSLVSPPNDGNRMPVGSSTIASELILQYNRGKVVVPESAVSGHGEVSYLPDMIECTSQSLLGRASTNTEDDVLIYNERMNEEMNSLDEVKIKRTGNPQVTDNQPAPKIRSISKITAPKGKKKKKRGRRKPIR